VNDLQCPSCGHAADDHVLAYDGVGCTATKSYPPVVWCDCPAWYLPEIHLFIGLPEGNQ
jgi:hypothetical protein